MVTTTMTDWANSETALAAAGYASQWKLPTFPLQPRSKVPATTTGVKAADLDPARWQWGETSDAFNVAVAVPEGLVVLDVDPRNGGDAAWASLLQDHPALDTLIASTAVPTVVTGSGGRHFWFRLPDGLSAKNGRLAGFHGIDVKTVGGYLVAPPSIHPETGAAYLWLVARDPHTAPVLPEAVCALLPLKREYVTPRVVEGDVNLLDEDDRPGAIFNREATWADVLLPHGWTDAGWGTDQEQFWLRPGGHSNQSASANYKGSGLLYIFSSEADPFEAGETYSKFAAYTLLNHEGDYSAAASELAEDQPDVDHGVTAESLLSQPTADVRDTGTQPTEPVYAFEPAFPPEHFVSQYIAYAAAQTDAASEYHEAAALSLIGGVSWGIRGRLSPFPGGLLLNLYIMLCGTTTRSRKSTSQRIARDLIQTIQPDTILPSRATTEAFIRQVSEKDGGVSAWLPDELGVTISQIYTQTFMHGLEELLLTLYAGDEYRYERVSAPAIIIRRPYLNILGAATPESVALAGPAATVGGLLPRFGVVLPATLPTARPALAAQDLSAPRAQLIQHLRALQGLRMTTDTVHYDADSLRVLNAAEMTLAGGPSLQQRLPTMLYKVAGLSALSRGDITANQGDAESAVKVVARWADGAARLQPYLRRKPQELEFEGNLQQALAILQSLGGEAHRSQIARRLEVKKTTLDTVEATLKDRGLLETTSFKGGKTWKSS